MKHIKGIALIVLVLSLVYVAMAASQILTSVTISTSNISIPAGSASQFTATAFDQNGTPISANFSWSSSDALVGTIDSASGLFTALTAGTTIITVTATNGTSVTNATTATVTGVQQNLTSVTISPLDPSNVTGTTVQFTATGFDQNGIPIGAILSWSNSNNSIGTVDNASGLFTALTAGTTTITVTAVNGTSVTNTTTVTVIPAMTITISPPTVSLEAGTTYSFTANDQPGNIPDTNVVWNSANSTVGTIDAAGLFTALIEGTTNITATNGSVVGTAMVNVIPHPGPPSVTDLIVAGRGTTWINWTWKNPTTGNFNHTLVTINGNLQPITQKEFFNYTQFTLGTMNNISLQTVDTSGHVNSTAVSDTTYTLNTTIGTNVVVSFNNVNVTFSQVNIEGNTMVNVLPSNPGGSIPSIGSFYNITTDSIFYSGNITVQVRYVPPADKNESNIKLYHLENSTWKDVTTNLDTAGKTVSGNVTSLSPFVVAVPPGPVITVISPPVDTNIVTSGSGSTTFQIKISQDATVNWFWGSSSVGSSSVSADVPINFTYTSTSTPDNYTFSVVASNINGNDSASWNWTVRSKTYFRGNRVWNGAKPNEYSLDYTWDPLSFYAFYYDLDTGTGNEALEINLKSYTDRNVRAGSLHYSTQPYSVSFQQTGWGQYDVIGFMADKYFAGYTSDTSGDITKTQVSPLNSNQLHKILTDDKTRRTVSAGSTLTLQEGYVISVKDVDAMGRIVLLSLLKDGAEVDTQPVSQRGTYVYSKKVGAVSDFPIIAIHVSNVFSGTEMTAAFTDGIFQISESFISTNSNNKYGMMEIISTSSAGITMENSNSFTLSQGSTVDIMGDLKFIVANNDTLRFAPMVQRSEKHEVRGTVAQNNDSSFEWTPMNFEGFYYNIDDDVGTEKLDITRSGTKVSSHNLIYTTTPQAVSYQYSNFGKFNVIGFMADKYFAGYIGCPTCITKQDISTIGSQQLHRVLIDDDTQRAIYAGSTLTLNEGYVVKIKDVSIGAGPANVWLSLLKDGTEVYSDVKNSGDIFTYAPSKTGIINDLPIISVRIDNIFRGKEATAAFAKGVFQISEKYTSINTGDNFGIMEVTEVSNNQIQMDNPSSLSVSAGSTQDVMGNIKFRVADSSDVRFYPFTTVNGTSVAANQLMIDAPATPMVKDTITVNVTDGTGTPIENAEVSFDGNVIGNTNGYGSFDYILTRSGQHTISATRLGYVPATITIQVSEYRDIQLKFELPALLDQGIRVPIRVISNGTAIQGANITLDGTSIGLTDSDGYLNYTFDISGTHNLGASKTGYIRVLREISIRMPFSEFQALDINFTPSVVFRNQNYFVRANISNVGTKTGTLPVGLVVNSSVVASQNVTLAPGAKQEINFTQKMTLAPGNYSVEILGQKKTMQVKEEPINIFLVAGLITVLGALIVYLATTKNRIDLDEIRKKLKFGGT